MDQLLTQINKLTTKTNSNTDPNVLLQQQQIITSQLSKLIDQAAQQIVCGPECQKQQKKEMLKQQYLKAETNMMTAPDRYEHAKKEYYVFAGGENGQVLYDEMHETELKNEAKEIANELEIKFNECIQTANALNAYYNSLVLFSSHIDELDEHHSNEIKDLTKNIKDANGDILTNDRKTYYETESIERLNKWYLFLWYLYYLLVIICASVLFLHDNTRNTSVIGNMLRICFLCVLPYLPLFILQYGWHIISRAYYTVFPPHTI